MQTILQQSYIPAYTTTGNNQSLLKRFITWCKNQEENRFLWLGLSLAVHACFMTPLTLFIVMLTGNSMLLWAFAIGAIGMAIVTNLAALPTKITIPAFLFSILIDLTLIAVCLSALF